ncbi:hypothetical protein BDW02DRAFT_371878 [Decorospora gaudefroyi]|uniref:Uncharacterized protein n=1 Tax=Decorospora gaudefroyi TaxID=184978 RepID=A0A6A5KBL4_9PLEO|nr:hypothetical protein BDW02DRAFT_371878 [Decorospora gaudefroyi]
MGYDFGRGGYIYRRHWRRHIQMDSTIYGWAAICFYIVTTKLPYRGWHRHSAYMACRCPPDWGLY